jgi:dsRNA-specific ribonuclease
MSQSGTFRRFIHDTLSTRTSLPKSHVDALTDPSAMLEFERAFTSKLWDPLSQWEWYELIGDVTTNKIVVWYYQRRFPDIFNPKTALGQGNLSPVATMARLKMNSISKRAYSGFARHLGFDRWIKIPECVDDHSGRPTLTVNPTPATPMKLAAPEAPKSDSACEDVFEAFIGCLEYLVDDRIGQHVGYAVCYDWMKTVLDECIQHVDMSLEALYDSRSLVNEIKSVCGSLMDCRIENHAVPGTGSPGGGGTKSMYRARYVVLVRRSGQPVIELRQPWFVATNKKDAQQLAAKFMLDAEVFQRTAQLYGLPLKKEPLQVKKGSTPPLAGLPTDPSPGRAHPGPGRSSPPSPPGR